MFGSIGVLLGALQGGLFPSVNVNEKHRGTPEANSDLLLIFVLQDVKAHSEAMRNIRSRTFSNSASAVMNKAWACTLLLPNKAVSCCVRVTESS